MSNNFKRQIDRKGKRELKKVDKDITEQLVEGLVAGVLEQTKNSLDVLNNNSTTLTRSEVVKSVANIFANETVTALDFMQPLEKQLTAKHKKCLKVFSVFKNNMQKMEKDILSITSENDPASIMFARLAVDFLTSTHVIMSVNTNSETRNQTFKTFVGRWED